MSSDESPTPEPLENANEQDPATTLSPAVRRLVRQYDLDITGVHGSGPSGRIKVGDVIGLLGGRGGPPAADRPRETPQTRPSAGECPATSVFECDLGRVLAHRQQRRQQSTEVLLTSYYLVACSAALQQVPEIVRDDADPRSANGVRLGVVAAAADGRTRTIIVDANLGAAPGDSLDDRLQAVDRALRAPDASEEEGPASLLIHHYGASGSLIATPTPIGEGHTASLGWGRMRRQIVVRTIDGEEAPRIATLCYVTLSFYPDLLELSRANRFLSELVRFLEQWE